MLRTTMATDIDNTFRTNRGTGIEWPTVALIVTVYAVLASLVWFHAVLPWWAILPIGAYAAALHTSLQHEALHGHPTRSRHMNEVLVFIAPTMWLPYRCYRDTHLTHHNDVHLTDPERDPESYYDLPETWARRGGWQRAIFAFNHTLLGRITIGPAVSIIRFWPTDIARIFNGTPRKLLCWSLFAMSCTMVISYVIYCEMPLWKYFLLISYPGISLALVRSYCEHQATPELGERTIVVEASAFWGLLFLNNNLHIAHHEAPKIPWYELPAYYRSNRERLLSKNAHYLFDGYGAIFSKYLLRAKEPIPYPDLAWLKS
jgi:fatty acid desaturase